MTGPDDLVNAISALPARCGDTVVVAIDGPSGAGKSRLARELASRLSATILRLDDVYGGWHGLAKAPPVVATEVLEPISRGEPGRTARWEWGANAPGADIVIAPGGFLILDGCGSGSRILRPYLSYLIWLDAPEDVRQARAFARDGHLYRQWWDIWAAQEAKLFASERTAGASNITIT